MSIEAYTDKTAVVVYRDAREYDPLVKRLKSHGLSFSTSRYNSSQRLYLLSVDQVRQSQSGDPSDVIVLINDLDQVMRDSCSLLKFGNRYWRKEKFSYLPRHLALLGNIISFSQVISPVSVAKLEGALNHRIT